MPDMEMLNVLDETGKIVGEAPRSEIHEKGLLHAEVHVWFYTPRGGLIFQHRAKYKETYPDKLDATAGGHVEIGDSYESSAVKEALEETGVHISAEDLTPIMLFTNKTFDEVTKKTNNYRRQIYAFRYEGAVAELKIEEGMSLGFEEWPIEKLLKLTPSEKERFIPTCVGDEGMAVCAKVKELL
jgi:isopentenyldiphosphate isomerase